MRKIVGKDIIIIIAANKADLDHKRQIDINDANNYANSVGAKTVSTSAKTGNGVEELFLELTKLLLKQHIQNEQTNRNQRGSRGPKTKIAVIDDTNFDNKKSDCACKII